MVEYCGRDGRPVGDEQDRGELLRPGARVWFRAGYRGYAFGFRVARTLD